VKSGAIADQLITFARRLCQGAPIKYRQLPATALDETCAFQLSGRKQTLIANPK